MAHTPHELAEEFPQYAAKMRELKAGNSHFAKLAEAYHEVNRAIHRSEAEIEPMGDTEEHEMRKKRMKLKDEIYALLAG